ncbi:hypothetical protein SAMN05518849_10188 [Sphingobium sp. AP50]|uniref:hypothetical protein n=1 Tax=Sphingobium sp. AP50 TaxID=1884369 RepID=UPI0008B9215A|nr:hypothetical protein [Sphingobium sp. AP50]SEI56338.1 hypothetical protein SAMN05518849_10188 [Sphingobium sp. AP50]
MPFKGFRGYLAEVEDGDRTLEVMAFYHFAADDVLAQFILSNMLTEDRKQVDLGQGRMIYFHTAHVTPGQDHLHFYQNGAKLYAINRDGSAHDASHGKKMARWAQDGVKDNYPGFTLPKSKLIETLLDHEGSSLLMESSGKADLVLVSKAIQILAVEEAAKA